METEANIGLKTNHKGSLREYMGRELRRIRKQRGMSQEFLADKMGVTRSTLSKIENGKFAISIDYLERFSIHLGFEIKVVISDIETIAEMPQSLLRI